MLLLSISRALSIVAHSILTSCPLIFIKVSSQPVLKSNVNYFLFYIGTRRQRLKPAHRNWKGISAFIKLKNWFGTAAMKTNGEIEKMSFLSVPHQLQRGSIPFIVRSLMPLRGRLSREPRSASVPGVALRGLYQGCRLAETLWPLTSFGATLPLPNCPRPTMRMSTQIRKEKKKYFAAPAQRQSSSRMLGFLSNASLPSSLTFVVFNDPRVYTIRAQMR